MKPSFKDDWTTVYCTDALTGASLLEPQSVHAIVTSPPYWGLRSYLDVVHADKHLELGAEKTPEEYVEKLVAIFRALRPALRDAGTLWLNLGDAYAGSWGNQGRKEERGTQRQINAPMMQNLKPYPDKQSKTGSWVNGRSDMKPKDLIGLPWMVAFALRADGWYLRSDIVWSKPNPMPESVTDRPTKSHEYLFLLTKCPRYYFDQEAVRERFTDERMGNPGAYKRTPSAVKGAKNHNQDTGFLDNGGGWNIDGSVTGRNIRSVWNIATRSYAEAHYATFPPALVCPCIKAGTSEYGVCSSCLAPWKRDKGQKKNEIGWQPTCSCGGPDDLAPGDLEVIGTPTGNRAGVDPSKETGRAGMNRPRGEAEGTRPITRYEQRRYALQLRDSLHKEDMLREAGPAFAHYVRTDRSGSRPVPEELLEAWIGRGWLERVSEPTLEPLDVEPATVLDPFVGSGTTALAARKLGRKSIGFDLDERNMTLLEERLGYQGVLL